MTYRDSKTVIENLTHADISKNRIHACVQKVGGFMNKERRKKPVDSAVAAIATEKEVEVREFDLLTGDGTKVHGRNGKKNEVHVILGKDQAQYQTQK